MLCYGQAWQRRGGIAWCGSESRSLEPSFVLAWRKNIQNEVQELDKMLEDDQPYAGMARQIVNRVFQLIDSG
jgi:hypothetical protein